MNEKSNQADGAHRSFELRKPSATNTASSGDFCINIPSRATTAVNSPTAEGCLVPHGFHMIAALTRVSATQSRLKTQNS